MSDIKLKTLGADPELFLVDTDTGEYVPATGLLGGSKTSPRPVNNGAVQEDNVLAEFNIDPAENAKQFVEYLTHVMQQLDDMVRPYSLQTQVVSSYEFTEQVLKEAGPAAFEFGCDPDFNAWLDGEQNPKPKASTGLRTAGGHVHFGIEGELDVNRFVRVCDLSLGLYSVLVDGDQRRRELYGAAGAYRPKPYGVEYRSMSNCWLSSTHRMRDVYKLAHAAVDLYNDASLVVPDEVQGIINTGNAFDADIMFRKYMLHRAL